jgi:hypothetical protein
VYRPALQDITLTIVKEYPPVASARGGKAHRQTYMRTPADTDTSRMTRRMLLVLVLTLAALIPAGAAYAAADKATTKPTVLADWTQPTAASTASWNAARLDRAPWASYAFDWSTDYCSASPDKPLGFDFTLSCWHHDFGYRNYKAIGAFPANKDRVDSMFYADLKRKCATYNAVVRPSCYSLAWTYYEAVHNFGSLAAVKQSDLDRAKAMMTSSAARA